MSQDNPTVAERLHKLASLYEEKNEIYGDDYKRHGDIMMALFPEGLTLDTAEDFNRYGVFKELVTKLNRYAKQWKNGGHPDSLNDQAVYSQMLQELDAEWRELYTIGDTLDVPHTAKPAPCGARKKPDGRFGCLECDISWDKITEVRCENSRHILL